MLPLWYIVHDVIGPVVGYSNAGRSFKEIASALLPQLSLEQTRAALGYYAEYPDEVDRILAEAKLRR